MGTFISIIIPLFNNQNKINKLLVNLKKINTSKIEIIFVDDCSTDRTYSIVKKRNLDEKKFFIYKTRRNLGPGIARNLGIKKSKSKYVMFLDSDDSLFINKLNKFLSFLSKKDFNICLFNKHEKKYFTTDKLKWTNNFFLESFRREVIFGVYNRRFILNNKIKFKKGYYEDIPFLYTLFLRNIKKILIYSYNIYKKSSSNNNSITKQLTETHIKNKINSWLYTFKIARKNNINLNSRILNYRMRGELVNIYEKINFGKNMKKTKNIEHILVSHAKKYVNKSDKLVTKKDIKFLKYFKSENI